MSLDEQEHISPIRQTGESGARLWTGAVAAFRAAMYALHLWLGEQVARRLLVSAYMRVIQSEKVVRRVPDVIRS